MAHKTYGLVAVLVAGCPADPQPTGVDSEYEPASTGTDTNAASDGGPAPDVTGSETSASGPDTTTGAGDPSSTSGDGESDTSTTTSGSTDDSSGEPDTSGLGCDDVADLLLCDDFEGDEIDPTVWTIIEANGAAISVDASLPFHGARSLHVAVPLANAARAAITTTAPFPVVDNHFFGRAMFYVSPEVPQSHVAVLGASGRLDGTLTQYRLDSNTGRFNSRYTNPVTVTEHGGLRKFGYDVPVEQWLCIEWEYDGGHNTMRYWMDGTEVESMTVTADSEVQPWVAPIFDTFEVGYRTFQAGTAPGGYDVYWDALALASSRIGCGR